MAPGLQTSDASQVFKEKCDPVSGSGSVPCPYQQRIDDGPWPVTTYIVTDGCALPGRQAERKHIKGNMMSQGLQTLQYQLGLQRGVQSYITVLISIPCCKMFGLAISGHWAEYRQSQAESQMQFLVPRHKPSGCT